MFVAGGSWDLKREAISWTGTRPNKQMICAHSTQISLDIRLDWSESVLFASWITSSCGQRKLSSDEFQASWSESSLGVQVILLFAPAHLSKLAFYMKCSQPQPANVSSLRSCILCTLRISNSTALIVLLGPIFIRRLNFLFQEHVLLYWSLHKGKNDTRTNHFEDILM